MTETRKPKWMVNSVAPIRICDNGGWTDTWFAGHGRIFNIGGLCCMKIGYRPNTPTPETSL
jgi:hypothetical protein